MAHLVLQNTPYGTHLPRCEEVQANGMKEYGQGVGYWDIDTHTHVQLKYQIYKLKSYLGHYSQQATHGAVPIKPCPNFRIKSK